MPTEPKKAVPVTPDVKADTPASEAGSTTTQTTTDLRGILDHLDIPSEVAERIAPKAEETPQPEPEPVPDETKPEDQADQQETPHEDSGEDTEGDDEKGEDTDLADESVAASVQPQKIDKRQKRINRLTRQKSELEAQLDAAVIQNQELRNRLDDGRQVHAQPAQLVGGNLPVIQQEIAKQDAILSWCDDNSEGGETGQGDKATFIDPKTVREWRRKAESDRQELVVQRQDELRTLSAVRSQADQEAFAILPEMFDRTKPEYQEAVHYIRQYPFLVNIPEANRALALLIQGRKALEAKTKTNGSGEVKHKGDIDPKAFTTPRVPIAPHTAEPPSRESRTSSTKKINEAMTKHIQDPDGEHLAEFFGALDESNRGKVGDRTAVKV